MRTHIDPHSWKIMSSYIITRSKDQGQRSTLPHMLTSELRQNLLVTGLQN